MGTFHCLSSCVCCLLLVSWLRVICWGRMLFDLVWHLCGPGLHPGICRFLGVLAGVCHMPT